jgi:hypothetical protein
MRKPRRRESIRPARPINADRIDVGGDDADQPRIADARQIGPAVPGEADHHLLAGERIGRPVASAGSFAVGVWRVPQAEQPVRRLAHEDGPIASRREVATLTGIPVASPASTAAGSSACWPLPPLTALATIPVALPAMAQTRRATPSFDYGRDASTSGQCRHVFGLLGRRTHAGRPQRWRRRRARRRSPPQPPELQMSNGSSRRIALQGAARPYRAFAYRVRQSDLRAGVEPVAVAAFNAGGQTIDRQTTGLS